MHTNPLHNLNVSISLSPCGDAEVIGYDEHQINRITIRIAQYWLFTGARVIFGHDWRDDGVMQAIGEFAEIASSNGELRSYDTDGPGWRILNLSPSGSTEISRQATHAIRNASGTLEVTTLHNHVKSLMERESMDDTAWIRRLPTNWEEQNFTRYWVLRQLLTQMLRPGIRICLGGKTHGYSGYYAGVAEEAYFALKYDKPLYLIGGFGGATRSVCSALSGGKLKSFSETGGLTKPEGPTIIKNAYPYGIPTNTLIDELSLFGKKWLSTGISTGYRGNGLSPYQNIKLFETTDIEFALSLISQGVSKLRERKQL